jgi:hypothetical protein
VNGEEMETDITQPSAGHGTHPSGKHEPILREAGGASANGTRYANLASVILVTAEDCHLCHDGLEVLERLAREFRLEVVPIDLDSPRGQELARSNRIVFPPGLFLDGEFIGFGRVSERRVRKLLSARTPSAVAAL